MRKINNKHYSLEVDPVKNRVYFKLIGHVPSVDAIPDFESDWMKVLDEMGLTKGFTILGDQRARIHATRCSRFTDEISKDNNAERMQESRVAS